jgi:hypothetical protein
MTKKMYDDIISILDSQKEGKCSDYYSDDYIEEMKKDILKMFNGKDPIHETEDVTSQLYSQMIRSAFYNASKLHDNRIQKCLDFNYGQLPNGLMGKKSASFKDDFTSVTVNLCKYLQSINMDDENDWILQNHILMRLFRFQRNTVYFIQATENILDFPKYIKSDDLYIYTNPHTSEFYIRAQFSNLPKYVVDNISDYYLMVIKNRDDIAMYMYDFSTKPEDLLKQMFEDYNKDKQRVTVTIKLEI